MNQITSKHSGAFFKRSGITGTGVVLIALCTAVICSSASADAVVLGSNRSESMESVVETIVSAEQAGLEVSTAYPGVTVKAGESLEFTLDFRSLNGEGMDAALSIESIPEGWEGYYEGKNNTISKVYVSGDAADSKGIASFHLSIPEETTEGSYTVELKAAAESGEDTLELTIDVSEIEIGNGSFTAEYPEQQGASGTSFTFDTTIVNNRGTEQTYSLSANAPVGWDVRFIPSGESASVASMTVDAGTSQGLSITVTPPETVTQDTYVIPCSVISANESFTTELTVEITGTYDVLLSTPTGRLSLDAYANTETSVNLSVTNLGNVDLENLNLTSSLPSGWEISFDESAIDFLEAGATREVTARLTPDENAITGDYVASIAIQNDLVKSSADFRVSVKTQTTWGIAAIAIIVVLLGILGFLIRKYGRR